MIIENTKLGRAILTGYVAMVTGAGQGISREVAHVLARLGAAVVIAEMSRQGLETQTLIVSAGGQAMFVQTEVGNTARRASVAGQARNA